MRWESGCVCMCTVFRYPYFSSRKNLQWKLSIFSLEQGNACTLIAYCSWFFLTIHGHSLALLGLPRSLCIPVNITWEPEFLREVPSQTVYKLVFAVCWWFKVCWLINASADTVAYLLLVSCNTIFYPLPGFYLFIPFCSFSSCFSQIWENSKNNVIQLCRLT